MLKELKNTFKEWWSGLTARVKLGYIILAIFALFVLVAVAITKGIVMSAVILGVMMFFMGVMLITE